MALPIIRAVLKNKKARQALTAGLGAVAGYFGVKKATKAKGPKPKKAVKRSMRWNKQLATTTEKKPTGARAEWYRKEKAAQKKSNLHSKPTKRSY